MAATRVAPAIPNVGRGPISSISRLSTNWPTGLASSSAIMYTAITWARRCSSTWSWMVVLSMAAEVRCDAPITASATSAIQNAGAAASAITPSP